MVQVGAYGPDTVPQDERRDWIAASTQLASFSRPASRK
jgi:hypothetical protein